MGQTEFLPEGFRCRWRHQQQCSVCRNEGQKIPPVRQADKPVVSHWLSDVHTPVRPDIEIGSVRSIMTAMVARIRIFPPSGGHSDDWRYRFSLRAGWMAGRPSPRRTDGRDAHECRRHPPCHRRDDMRRARKSIKMIANAIVIRPQHHTVWDSIR